MAGNEIKTVSIAGMIKHAALNVLGLALFILYVFFFQRSAFDWIVSYHADSSSGRRPLQPAHSPACDPTELFTAAPLRWTKQHADMSRGDPIWPGSNGVILQHAPLLELLNTSDAEAGGAPELDDGNFEWDAGVVPSLDYMNANRSFAKKFIVHDIPLVWRDRRILQLAASWKEQIRLVQPMRDWGAKPSAEDAALTLLSHLPGRAFRLAEPYSENAPGISWRVKYHTDKNGTAAGHGSRSTSQHMKLGQLVELYRAAADDRAGLPPYYASFALGPTEEGDGHVAWRLPPEFLLHESDKAFRSLPGMTGIAAGKYPEPKTQNGATCPRLHCDTNMNMLVGFSPVTYGCHFDFPRNWLMQLGGVKRVVIVHPQEGLEHLQPELNSKMPEWRQALVTFLRDVGPDHSARHVRGLQTWLHPGDALFIPPGWFHYIESAPKGPDEFWLTLNRFCAGGLR